MHTTYSQSGAQQTLWQVVVFSAPPEETVAEDLEESAEETEEVPPAIFVVEEQIQVTKPKAPIQVN